MLLGGPMRAIVKLNVKRLPLLKRPTVGFTLMEEELTPSGEGCVRPVVPIYRPEDTIVFKYEGNVRAEVTGHQVLGGRSGSRHAPRTWSSSSQPT